MDFDSDNSQESFIQCTLTSRITAKVQAVDATTFIFLSEKEWDIMTEKKIIPHMASEIELKVHQLGAGTVS